MADKPERNESQPSADGDKQSWIWRYEIQPPIDETSYKDDIDVGTAWLRLQLIHTSFRLIHPKDYRELSARLEEIERLFLDRKDLLGYYDQCFAPENELTKTGPRGTVYREREVAHVAAIQIQFLEDMFFALDLDRYANAPDNRGWMNLFRRWGRSPTFNHQLDALRSTLTLGFLEFYDLYLRYHQCRIDEKPIPHPWDALSRRRDYRAGDDPPPPPLPPTGGEPGPCGGPAASKRPGTVPYFPGLFLDSGIYEVTDRSPTEPDVRGGSASMTSAGGGSQGQKDTKSGDPGAVDTPSPTAEPPTDAAGQ